MTTTALPLTGKRRMAYETPPQGITLTGYIARRMHKTRLLEDMVSLVREDPLEALVRFGMYAAAAGTSYGPALYQPRFDGPGAVVSEQDPDTGARITVQQNARSPHYSFSYEVNLPDGSRITGEEQILGTTVGLRGLGMPAPSAFRFDSADGAYQAFASGTIHSELAPGLGRWRVRGYADLQLEDSSGNRGALSLDRKGRLKVKIHPENGPAHRVNISLDQRRAA